MKWGLSIAFFCALSVVPPAVQYGHASEKTHDSGQLLKVVILSRHGVRAPAQSPEELAGWSRKNWPRWPVAPGELTPRGAALVTELWRRQGLFLRDCGLLPARMCPPSGTIVVRADNEQRTEATAAALLEGLAPGCGLKAAVDTAVRHDPLFHPVEAGYCALDPVAVSREISPESVSHLERTLADPVAELEAILGPASDAYCRGHGLPDGCTTADVPTTLQADATSVHLKGRLGTASSATEVMLLEYGQWSRPAGWNTVDRARLERLLPIHSRVFDAVNRAPSVAAARGSGLLLDMANALTGKYADSAVNRAKVVVFVGHDTNIAAVAGLLGLHWHLPGYAADEIPPAGALMLSLWLQDGQYRIRVHMTGQSLETLHDPAMDGAVLRQFVDVPWCGSYRDDPICRLTEFELRVRNVIRPDCVRER